MSSLKHFVFQGCVIGDSLVSIVDVPKTSRLQFENLWLINMVFKNSQTNCIHFYFHFIICYHLGVNFFSQFVLLDLKRVSTLGEDTLHIS